MRKTLAIINQKLKILKEQDQAMPPMPMPPEGAPTAPAAPESTEPPPEPKQFEFTSSGENEYVKNIIDALFFDPSKLSGEQQDEVLKWRTDLETPNEKINAREIKNKLLHIIAPDESVDSNLSQL